MPPRGWKAGVARQIARRSWTGADDVWRARQRRRGGMPFDASGRNGTVRIC